MYPLLHLYVSLFVCRPISRHSCAFVCMFIYICKCFLSVCLYVPMCVCVGRGERYAHLCALVHGHFLALVHRACRFALMCTGHRCVCKCYLCAPCMAFLTICLKLKCFVFISQFIYHIKVNKLGILRILCHLNNTYF